MGMMIHRRKLREKANGVKEIPKVEMPKVVEEPKAVEKPKSTLTRDDIEKLPYFSLKSLASQYGVDVEDKKAKEIRKELLEKLEV